MWLTLGLAFGLLMERGEAVRPGRARVDAGTTVSA
jgi:hypothetical protein